MKAIEKYAIYRLKSLLGKSDHKILEPVEFSDAHEFDSETEAIAKLIQRNMFYEDFVILKHIHIAD